MSVSTLQPPNEKTCINQNQKINPYGIDELTHQPPKEIILENNKKELEHYKPSEQCQVEENSDLPQNQVETISPSNTKEVIIITSVCAILYAVLLCFVGY
ncbi:hypothetical protein ENUP19_0158G0023 [Entamoeba nuttalli]|uniref:Uncharacterized protein n=1 Tax=Entamoeba nuttalli TaxID=412467 RepID=A0ABQ0DLD6_9EUKA